MWQSKVRDKHQDNNEMTQCLPRHLSSYSLKQVHLSNSGQLIQVLHGKTWISWPIFFYKGEKKSGNENILSCQINLMLKLSVEGNSLEFTHH